MKFAKQLGENMRPEWRQHYIPYKELKKALAAMSPDAERENSEETWEMRKLSDNFEDQTIEVAGEQASAFLQRVEREAQRVRLFINEHLQELEDQLAEIEAAAVKLEGSESQTLEAPAEELAMYSEVFSHKGSKYADFKLLECMG